MQQTKQQKKANDRQLSKFHQMVEIPLEQARLNLANLDRKRAELLHVIEQFENLRETVKPSDLNTIRVFEDEIS